MRPVARVSLQFLRERRLRLESYKVALFSCPVYADRVPPGAARAEPPESLPPDSERGTAFERFFIEHPWLTTGMFLAGGGLLAAFADDPADPRWAGGSGFEDSVRSGLRLGSERGRDRADLASDVFQYTLIAAPYLDALAYYTLTRDPEVALVLLEDLRADLHHALVQGHLAPFAGRPTDGPGLEVYLAPVPRQYCGYLHLALPQ